MSLLFLQGGFTRTGRRDIRGVLVDGKISANRYYRRFKKDTLRQQCYDAMQKQNISTKTNVEPDLDIPNEAVRRICFISIQFFLSIRFPIEKKF